MITSQYVLEHYDTGRLWPQRASATPGFDLAAAYQTALAVRALRVARGEKPLGYKIGFTNRTIWERYQVYGPIWGPVWDTTVRHCDGDQGRLSLAGTCQPRIEPEIVFGLRATPAPDATLDSLFEAIDWLAPGFEIVHTHLPDWKFAAADTVADGALHARLLVGRKKPVRDLAPDAQALDRLLGAVKVDLCKGEQVVDSGVGANVLDSPLRALLHFLTEMRQCPGAPDLAAGDVVTTGTLTDAWPVAPGERWSSRLSAPLWGLAVDFD